MKTSGNGGIRENGRERGVDEPQVRFFFGFLSILLITIYRSYLQVHDTHMTCTCWHHLQWSTVPPKQQAHQLTSPCLPASLYLQSRPKRGPNDETAFRHLDPRLETRLLVLGKFGLVRFFSDFLKLKPKPLQTVWCGFKWFQTRFKPKPFKIFISIY